jgi:hypothetical protein
MNTHRYYPELHNPQLHPSAEPYIDVRFRYNEADPLCSYYEIVETSGPVYVGDKSRFYFSGTTFNNVQNALDYVSRNNPNKLPIYYSVL